MKCFWNKQRLALWGVAAVIVMALAYPLTYWLKHQHVSRMHSSCANHAIQLKGLALSHMLGKWFECISNANMIEILQQELQRAGEGTVPYSAAAQDLMRSEFEKRISSLPPSGARPR
ncbi:MAG: hypothetical protein ACKVHO_10060 [Verrucomicrobiia bacterium]|jgi:hypothetical protein